MLSSVTAALRGLAGIFVTALFCSATAHAVELVKLSIEARSRPYGPQDPVTTVEQQFSVPDGPGTLIMTYTEERYVGGPGGFTLNPKDLSNEYIGWGGSTEYTPRNPPQGQPYRVQTIWRHSFSKKLWVATLMARHSYQAFQIRDRGQQIESRQRLTVEFIPGTTTSEPKNAPIIPGTNPTGGWNWGAGGGVVEIGADGTGKDSRGNTMRWTVRDAAAGVYELRWSHGYTDTATLSADSNTLTVINNAGTRFAAARRIRRSNLIGSWDWGAGGGVVEIKADGTGKDSRGNSMRWTVRDAAARVYELKWSHGFTDSATLSADGYALTVVNNAGTRFSATPRPGQ